MPVNGALRFAWIWIPVLAFLFGTLPITEQAVSEWDSDILKATSAPPVEAVFSRIVCRESVPRRKKPGTLLYPSSNGGKGRVHPCTRLFFSPIPRYTPVPGVFCPKRRFTGS